MAKSKRTTAIDKVLEKLSLAATGGEEIEGMSKADAIKAFIQLAKVEVEQTARHPSKMTLQQQLRQCESIDEQTAYRRLELIGLKLLS